jgi:hypothetical protein
MATMIIFAKSSFNRKFFNFDINISFDYGLPGHAR